MSRTRALCLWVALSACTGRPEPLAEPPAKAEPESAGARYVPVESALGSALFDAPARVASTPEDSAVVSAPLSLRVVKVRVRPGQEVKQGDALVDVAMPELIRALGALAAADLRIGAYESRRARLGPLVGEGLARAGDLAELEAQVALARADREAARAVVRTAGVGDEAAGSVAQNGLLALRAPISGVVVGVAARTGAVWEPSSGPLVELAQAASSLIEARFQLLPPDAARFVWLGAGGERALVRVRVSPRALPEDGSRLVWLAPEVPDATLVPGLLGRVRVVADPSWMVVPASAVVYGAQGAAVFLEGESAAHAVELVQASATEAVVRGLAPGARVLAAAASRSTP